MVFLLALVKIEIVNLQASIQKVYAKQCLDFDIHLMLPKNNVQFYGSDILRVPGQCIPSVQCLGH